MARLAAQAKLLYYPTDSDLVRLLTTWFTTNGEATRIADPCCGKGDALALFADQFAPRPETWGVEKSYSRAQLAEEKLDRLLPASFYHVMQPGKWDPKSVSLMFNNPPYDWSDLEETRGGIRKKIRHEFLFAEWGTTKIVPGGHHILIVPRNILGNAAVTGTGNETRLARHLLGWYEEVGVYHAENSDWKAFSQVVVLALNRREKYKAPTKERIESITHYSEPVVEIPILVSGKESYVIPPTPENNKFIYTPVNDEDLVRLGQKCSPLGTPEYFKATYVRSLGAPFEPATPLKIGHITMLISGQEAGVLKLEDEDGNALLVKGRSKKIKEATTTDNTNDEGRYTSTKVVARERHITTIAIVRSNGDTKLIHDHQEVGDFITKHASEIADAILDKNKPTYNYMPSQELMDRLSGIAVELPPLPGREERGLFLTQKHFAIAMYLTLLKHRTLIMNAEMGFGKTSTSIGGVSILDKWPGLVWCPNHMVYKWRRDLTDASDQKDPITARVITRPTLDSYPVKVEDPETEENQDLIRARKYYPMENDIFLAKAPAWLWIKDEIEGLGGTILETERFQINPDHVNDTGMRRRVKISCVSSNAVEEIRILMFKQSFRSTGKSGTVAIKPEINVDGRIVEAVFYDRDEYTMKDFYEDYTAGRLGERSVAICAFDPVKYDSGWNKEPATRKGSRTHVEEEKYNSREFRAPAHICANCGATIGLLEDNLSINRPKCPECGDAIFNFNRWRRVGLARLIQKRYKHFFKFVIADEVHKTKGGHTDIGVADQRLISSIKYSIALTGTLFGGTAGSIFYLLYRRVPELRRLYDHDELFRWVDHYGLWEETWTQSSKVYEGEIGASTGVRRYNYRRKELPGVAPGVIRYLLPITLFGNITDLGYELPPLYEDMIAVDMTEPQAKQYDKTNSYLFTQAIELAKAHGDPGGLSVWFNTNKFRPNSAFRNETVHYESKKVPGEIISYELPAVIGGDHPWLPKEIALANIVRTNMENGRRTICFMEQTHTRDIRDRLRLAVETLVPDGKLSVVEVGQLSANSMKPAKREMWIRQHAPSMNVFLTNPRLVETGLDLVMFSDLVFYEMTLSLYTLWQSMRRVWRLGQEKEVRVKFLVYKNTVEMLILQRMGIKMKYAQLLYGESASGVLVDTSGDEDIQNEIIREALEGKAFESVGDEIASIFGTGSEKTARITTAPQGSVIAVSPTVTVIDLPDGDHMQLTLLPGIGPAPKMRRRKPRRKAPSSEQTGLWGFAGSA